MVEEHNAPDAGISYDQAPDALKKLLKKVAARKQAVGEESNRSMNGLPQVAFAADYPLPVVRSVVRKYRPKGKTLRQIKRQGAEVHTTIDRAYPRLNRALGGTPSKQRAFKLSAMLDRLIQFADDPRPRNNLGEFVPPAEGGPDRNAIATTYSNIPKPKTMSKEIGQAVLAAPLVGAGGTAGGLAVKALADKINARKALRKTILKS